MCPDIDVQRFTSQAPPIWMVLVVAFGVVACTPKVQDVEADPVSAVRVEMGGYYETADGRRLALRAWGPRREPRAVVLALHGMNDYSGTFDDPAQTWSEAGILTVAYDQRGFGEDPQAGIWADREALVRDARDLARWLRDRYTDVPVYLVGDSLGGAVAIVAATGEARAGCEGPDAGPDCDCPVAGIVLISPAVAGRETMSLLERAGLWLVAHTFPWASFRVDGQYPGYPNIYDMSDNPEHVKEQLADPLFLDETRVDAAWGLLDLMDAALASAPALRCRTLVLFGRREKAIPADAARLFLERLPAGRWQLALYEHGYHNLLHGLRERRVPEDVAAWILDPRLRAGEGSLPSGAPWVRDPARLAFGD